jgi:hypothetical protein
MLDPYTCGTCGDGKIQLKGVGAGIIAECKTCGRQHEDACMTWVLIGLASPPPKEHLDAVAAPAAG